MCERSGGAELAVAAVVGVGISFSFTEKDASCVAAEFMTEGLENNACSGCGDELAAKGEGTAWCMGASPGKVPGTVNVAGKNEEAERDTAGWFTSVDDEPAMDEGALEGGGMEIPGRLSAQLPLAE
jgi:hypothetical protein